MEDMMRFAITLKKGWQNEQDLGIFKNLLLQQIRYPLKMYTKINKKNKNFRNKVVCKTI